MKSLEIRPDPPPVGDFISWRERCDWGTISKEAANTALEQSFLNYSAWSPRNLVGFVRVIGDGALYYYVQDLIVHESCRGLGVGRRLMRRVLADLGPRIGEGGSVSLLSSIGNEAFYETLGFSRRPNAHFGAGMTLRRQSDR